MSYDARVFNNAVKLRIYMYVTKLCVGRVLRGDVTLFETDVLGLATISRASPVSALARRVEPDYIVNNLTIDRVGHKL